MTVPIKYLIVGNGIAGLAAAETIRKNDEKGKITIITNESYLTYSRVKLTHFISKNFKDEELMIRDEKWYQERNIEVKLNKVVKKIDTNQKQVLLADGEGLPYDKLLLANGSRPFIPPIKGNEKTGVFALRTIEDLKEFQDYLKGCKNVTVLGGGLLGLEAAWALKELNKEVNVVEFFPHLCPRQLDKEMSKKFEDMLQAKGLNLYLGCSTEEILGYEKVEGIKLEDGRKINTDAILISAGVRPRLEILQDTEIKHDKGIIVDEHMMTNIADVYAAGDVAELQGTVVGLWGISNDQGKVTGENMTGGNQEYHLPEITTLLNIAGISVFSAGSVKDAEEILQEVDKTKNAHYKLFIINNRATGGIVMNDMSKVQKMKRMVSNRIDLSEELREGLGLVKILESI